MHSAQALTLVLLSHRQLKKTKTKFKKKKKSERKTQDEKNTFQSIKQPSKKQMWTQTLYAGDINIRLTVLYGHIIKLIWSLPNIFSLNTRVWRCPLFCRLLVKASLLLHMDVGCRQISKSEWVQPLKKQIKRHLDFKNTHSMFEPAGWAHRPWTWLVSEWREYGTMKKTIPGDSTVSCLHVDAGVGEVAPHDIVSKVWLQDMEIGIYSNLQIRPQPSSSLVLSPNKSSSCGRTCSKIHLSYL